MSNSIDINGKELLTIKDASELVDYSRDYITRLARERKIVATQIGRKWYVDIDSLKSYQSVSKAEQEIKKQRLSDDRKKELAIKSIKQQKYSAATKHAERKLSVAVMTCLIMFLGFGIGALIEREARDGFVVLSQIANLKSGLQQTVTTVVADDAFSTYAEPVITATVEPVFRPSVSYENLTINQDGLMLLSDSENASIDIQEYFSDPVEIITATSGDSFLVRVDENGDVIGDPVPFVLVPVNSNSP